jgi:hypothetical protein
MKYKLFIKLMLLFLALILIGPFLIKDKDGKPYASLDRIELPHISVPKFSIPTLFSSKKKETEYIPVETEVLSPALTTPNPAQEVIKIYTFKDKMGVSHYTNKKPDHEEYQVLYMPVNKEDKKSTLSKIKDKLKDIAQKVTPQKPSSGPKPTSEESKFSLSDIYSQPSKTITDAKELKKQIESTYSERDRMMENLNN